MHHNAATSDTLDEFNLAGTVKNTAAGQQNTALNSTIQQIAKISIGPKSRILFRTIHDNSQGLAAPGEDIRSGDWDSQEIWHQLRDYEISIDCGRWLIRNGEGTEELSIGTSFTSDIVRVFSTALRFRSKGYSGTTILVVQEAFLVPGTCFECKKLIELAGIPPETFQGDYGHLKETELIVIGYIPARAVVSRLTLEDLGILGFFKSFPTFNTDSATSVKKARLAMTSVCGTFKFGSHESSFFLSSLLGRQEHSYLDDASTRLLLLHFAALSKPKVNHRDVTKFLESSDKDVFFHLERLVGQVNALHSMFARARGQGPVVITEKIYGLNPIEELIRIWAERNPYVAPAPVPARPVRSY